MTVLSSFIIHHLLCGLSVVGCVCNKNSVLESDDALNGVSYYSSLSKVIGTN
jgi:hypothetical protein